MVKGVPQHVFQWRDHALQDVAIHLAFGVANVKFDLLAELTADLPNNPAQARNHRSERNHPRLHQTFLKFRVDP